MALTSDNKRVQGLLSIFSEQSNVFAQQNATLLLNATYLTAFQEACQIVENVFIETPDVAKVLPKLCRLIKQEAAIIDHISTQVLVDPIYANAEYKPLPVQKASDALSNYDRYTQAQVSIRVLNIGILWFENFDDHMASHIG